MLRAKLTLLVEEKRKKSAEPDLVSVQHHLSPEVNPLKKQIDLFKTTRKMQLLTLAGHRTSA
jgi:hypothetical protein